MHQVPAYKLKACKPQDTSCLGAIGRRVLEARPRRAGDFPGLPQPMGSARRYETNRVEFGALGITDP